MTKDKESRNDPGSGLTLPPDENSDLNLNREQSIKCAQQILRTYVKKDTPLVDKFIKYRREEAAKE